MRSLFSCFQKSSEEPWGASTQIQMRRIENYYLGATDIPPRIRQQVAYRKLLEIPPFTPLLAQVTISQWDEIGRQRGIPVDRSDRYAGRAIRFRQKCSKQTLAAAQESWQSLTALRLGQMLEEAGLLSATQVNAILGVQRMDDSHRFGEIAVQCGLMKQITADFFAERLPKLVKATWRYPLGQYLRLAALLDDEQTSTILMEQCSRRALFGDIAVAKGWIGRQTVDWFLSYI